MYLCSRHNAPSPDFVICVTSEEGLTIGAPSQADTFRLPALFADLQVFGLELVNLALFLEVEDDDTAGSSSAKPVTIRGEDEGVDLVTSSEGIEMLGLIEVPEHGGTVLATRSAERAVRRDGDGVDVTSMTNMIGLDAARCKLPDLFHELALLKSWVVVLSLILGIEDQCIGDWFVS